MKGKWKNITDEKPMITSGPWVYRSSVFFIDVLWFYMQFTNRFILECLFTSTVPNVPTHFRDSKQDRLAKGISGFQSSLGYDLAQRSSRRELASVLSPVQRRFALQAFCGFQQQYSMILSGILPTLAKSCQSHVSLSKQYIHLRKLLFFKQ